MKTRCGYPSPREALESFAMETIAAHLYPALRGNSFDVFAIIEGQDGSQFNLTRVCDMLEPTKAPQHLNATTPHDPPPQSQSPPPPQPPPQLLACRQSAFHLGVIPEVRRHVEAAAARTGSRAT